jgi:hypothetical protein
MAFKTAAELFGDDGANGAAVPYSTTNPAGTASANRGIQFGEQLTAEIANRPHYALALNDEDLNDRLVVFETDGLDAAYRLGDTAVAGGGRVITLDDAAVETVSSHATNLGRDISNAHFRANATGDLADGGGGFEFNGLVGSAQHVARYGFMDRRSFPLNTARTVVAISQAAVLNLASVGATKLTLSSGQWMDGSSNTDIIPLLDMVEILSGAYAGVYVISALDSASQATLQHLDGTSPSFAADTAVTFRLCRPFFMTSAPYSGSTTAHLARGVTIAGLPTDNVGDAALTIIPGGRGGLDADGTDGHPWALRIKRATVTGATANQFSITAAGSVRNFTTSVDKTTGDRGTAWGSPAFHHIATAGSAGYECSFIGTPSDSALDNYYGLFVGEHRGTHAFTFSATGLGFEFTPTDGIEDSVHNGQLIEVLTPSDQSGIYRIINADTGSTSPLTVTVEQLDGTDVSWPTGGAGTFRFFTGVAAGRFTLKIPSQTAVLEGGFLQDDVHASMMITAPQRNAASGATTSDVGLMIFAREETNDAFIRCATRTQEVFALNADGDIDMDGALNVGGAGAFNGAITGFSLGLVGTAEASGYDYSSPPARVVIVPLTSFQPNGAGSSTTTHNSTSGVSPNHNIILGSGEAIVAEVRLPAGSTFTRCRAVVKQLNDDPVDMKLEVFYCNHTMVAYDPATEVVMTSLGDDVAADDGIDLLTVTDSQLMVGSTDTIVIQITASGGPIADYVGRVDIQFTDPGPRHH